MASKDKKSVQARASEYLPAARVSIGGPATWYVRLANDNEFGPLSVEELGTLIHQGAIPRTSFLRSSTSRKWRPIAEVVRQEQQGNDVVASRPPPMPASLSPSCTSLPPPIALSQHAETCQSEVPIIEATLMDPKADAAQRAVGVAFLVLVAVAVGGYAIYQISSGNGEKMLQGVGKLIAMGVASWLGKIFLDSKKPKE